MNDENTPLSSELNTLPTIKDRCFNFWFLHDRDDEENFFKRHIFGKSIYFLLLLLCVCASLIAIGFGTGLVIDLINGKRMCADFLCVIDGIFIFVNFLIGYVFFNGIVIGLVIILGPLIYYVMTKKNRPLKISMIATGIAALPYSVFVVPAFGLFFNSSDLYGNKKFNCTLPRYPREDCMAVGVMVELYFLVCLAIVYLIIFCILHTVKYCRK